MSANLNVPTLHAYLNVHGTPESMSTSMSMEHQKVGLPQCPWNTRNMPSSKSMEHQKVHPPQCPGNSSVTDAYLNVHKTPAECAYINVQELPETVYPNCRNHQKMSAHLDALVITSESMCAQLNALVLTSERACAYLDVLGVSDKRAERVDTVQGPQLHGLVV